MIRTKVILMLCLCFAVSGLSSAQTTDAIQNAALSVQVRPNDGSYQITSKALRRAVLASRVGVEINHLWLLSTSYPRHQAADSTFQDELGSGHLLTVTYSGLEGKPDLICHLRLYDDHPYGDVSVEVHNTTRDEITVNTIRVVDAIGQPRVDLGASEQDDRVLAESFSEDPMIRIGGLDQAPHGVYFGVRNILLYNLKSQQSLMLAALTSNRFLTVSHLQVSRRPSQGAGIGSFTVDSTGTTEGVLERDQIPSGQQVQLSLPVPAGGTLSSERVLFASGPDYLAELEAYGEAIRLLHHALIAETAPMGWWSWTAFYGGITAGDVLTNA
ncbi:MAG: alpha-galactosidase, partial [Candidatus Dormibacteraceae bacterium]